MFKNHHTGVYVCVFVFECVCMHDCAYVCMYVCICSCMHVYICVCVYIHACVFMPMCICMCVCVYIYVCVYMYICVYMCVCVFACTHVWQPEDNPQKKTILTQTNKFHCGICTHGFCSSPSTVIFCSCPFLLIPFLPSKNLSWFHVKCIPLSSPKISLFLFYFHAPPLEAHT